MGMVGIRSRLLARKTSDGQSKPPYSKGNLEKRKFTDPDKVWMNDMGLGDPFNVLGDTYDMWKHINNEETHKLMQDMANINLHQAHQAHQALQAQQAQQVTTHNYGSGGSGGSQAGTSPNRLTPGQILSSRAREMFLKRMGGIRSELKIHEDDFLHCHVYQDMVYLFYCFSGRDGCVKEGIDLFPSDQLITQFRMVLST